MPDMTQFELETERLLLVAITMDYVDVIFDEFTPEVTFYMHPRSPHRIEETMHFIRESRWSGLERGSNLQLVALKERNTRIFRMRVVYTTLMAGFPSLVFG